MGKGGVSSELVFSGFLLAWMSKVQISEGGRGAQRAWAGFGGSWYFLMVLKIQDFFETIANLFLQLHGHIGSIDYIGDTHM